MLMPHFRSEFVIFVSQQKVFLDIFENTQENFADSPFSEFKDKEDF
jgi:hypothetical protein